MLLTIQKWKYRQELDVKRSSITVLALIISRGEE